MDLTIFYALRVKYDSKKNPSVHWLQPVPEYQIVQLQV